MDGQGQHYDSETYAGDRADQVNRSQRNLPQEDRSTRAELEAHVADDQSARLAPHVRMGDDRAIGSPPNWEAMSSTELHNAATQRNSPETADNLGRAFNEGGNRLAEAANRLLAAVSKLDAAWSGKAADAARGALAPLAESAGQAGLTAQLMGAQMARQTAAASEVRKLPPPQEFDHQAELQQALANPNPIAGMADMKAKKDKADAVKREQVAYLNAYTQTMSAVDGQTPSFIEPAASISGGDGSSSRITAGTIDYRGPSGGDPHQGTTPAPGGRVVGVPGFGAPGAGDGTEGQDPDIAALPGFGPGAGTGSSGFTPSAAPASGLPGGPGAGAAHAGPPGAGAGGFGNAFGSFGAPGASGTPSRGPAAAGGPGAADPTGSAGRGGAAGAGRAGAAGAGGLGAGRGGRKEEDEEHERPSYLIEGDPEGTFGSDEPTAPPVIGQEGP